MKVRETGIFNSTTAEQLIDNRQKILDMMDTPCPLPAGVYGMSLDSDEENPDFSREVFVYF